MYGFAEEANDADDAYLSPESIESGIYEYESKIPAIKAKIKLLQNHGFMDEGKSMSLLFLYYFLFSSCIKRRRVGRIISSAFGDYRYGKASIQQDGKRVKKEGCEWRSYGA